MDLYLSEDHSFITVDAYFSAFVYAFDHTKGGFKEHYAVRDKFTVWTQPNNFILSCEKPGYFELHHAGLRQVRTYTGKKCPSGLPKRNKLTVTNLAIPGGRSHFTLFFSFAVFKLPWCTVCGRSSVELIFLRSTYSNRFY